MIVMVLIKSIIIPSIIIDTSTMFNPYFLIRNLIPIITGIVLLISVMMIAIIFFFYYYA